MSNFTVPDICDLHEDIRNIAYRYMFGGLGKKNLKDLKNFEKYKSLNKNFRKFIPKLGSRCFNPAP